LYCTPLAAVLDTPVFGRAQNVTNQNPVRHVYLDDDDEDSRGVRDGSDAVEHRNCLPCYCVSAWTGFRHAKQVVLPPTATTTHILSTNHDTKLSVSESRKERCCDYHT